MNVIKNINNNKDIHINMCYTQNSTINDVFVVIN